MAGVQGKTKVVLFWAVFCLACAPLWGCSSAGDASKFAGTWDLRFGISESNADSLSEENVSSMRALGIEAYLNLEENGSLALVSFDGAKYGSWEPKDALSAEAEIEGVSATIEADGDTLKLLQPGTTLTFSKGDPKESGPSAPKENAQDQAGASGESGGLSEVVVRGALLDSPLTIVDDALCTIVVNGTGVDRWGDPGYNLEIANHGEMSIDVWVLDPFSVDGVQVKTYLFETVEPERSATAFMQFDIADLSTMGTSSLVDVSGMLLVDDDTNTTIAEYPFNVA